MKLKFHQDFLGRHFDWNTFKKMRRFNSEMKALVSFLRHNDEEGGSQAIRKFFRFSSKVLQVKQRTSNFTSKEVVFHVLLLWSTNLHIN